MKKKMIPSPRRGEGRVRGNIRRIKMIYKSLKEKILKRKARIGIIGLGYVGLPLALEFAKEGFEVTGIDIDKKRVNSINRGNSYILDISSKDLRPLVQQGLLKATSDYKVLKSLDAIIICVPTPLRKTKEPDISFIVGAVEKISACLKKGHLIILESTTYPGTTEEMILPLLKSKKFEVGREFFLAFSPERVDPANKFYQIRNIPKVVGGVTKRCSALARVLYEQIVEQVVSVSSTKAAEMVKLLENTFRSVNIGLANELALLCNRFGIDVWEVIEAAETKPFGFMPFYPGPGLGGHCIPTDPIYLSWKARILGFEARFIELASQVNSYMPHYVVEKVTRVLNRVRKSLKDSKVLVVGVAYKKDVNDTRESPAIEIIRLLKERQANVKYFDPFVPELMVDGKVYRSVAFNRRNLQQSDCVLVVTNHSQIDLEFLLKNSRCIVDTRNALREVKGTNRKVVKL